MKDATRARLSPPEGDHYRAVEFVRSGDRLIDGYLVCETSGTGVPVCDGFALFTEAGPAAGEPSTAGLEELRERLFGSRERYRGFIEEKWRRPAYDLYAAFQPFNESSQSLFPFIGILRQIVQPGETILDLWCRTGWSGELLAALFPEQQIVSLWERNGDVLGYRGFRHWLGAGDRAENLDIVFHDPDLPLPFDTDSVAVVHGLDSLHRYEQSVLLPESLRVCRDGGIVLFPHVHLTNSEPDPWFDRGELQLHGTTYRDRFETLFADSRRFGFVLSERGLFEGDYEALLDDAETSHYNALIGIADRQLSGARLGLPSFQRDLARCYLLVNPLYRLDLDRQQVEVGSEALAGQVGQLLDRHPIYRHRMEALGVGELSNDEALVLFWAERVLPVGEIGDRLGMSMPRLEAVVGELERRQLVQARPISRAMAALQHFYSTQLWEPPAEEQTLAALWAKSVVDHAESPFAISAGDGSEFSYADADQIMTLLRAGLARAGVGRGDRVALYAEASIEGVLVFWATVSLGAVFVPLDREWPAAMVERALECCGPVVLFTDDAQMAERSALDSILLDDEEQTGPPAGATLLSDWLEAASGVEHAAAASEVSEGDPATVLFTSGTTGTPKGVELSHGALWRSARSMTRTYEWKSTDIVMSAGGLHSMSGLRNPVIAPVAVGAACLVAAPAQRRHPLTIAAVVDAHRATILSVLPAFLKRLLSVRDRLEGSALASVRLVLSTAAELSPELAERVERRFGAPVFDYYGLTETCGLCIASSPSAPASPGSIGTPVGAIVQIVDEEGEIRPSGEVGELRVYSDRLMSGYLDEPALTGEILRDGWIYTGDLARRLADGGIELLARRREFIKHVGGDIVFPSEIEAALAADARVAEVAVRPYSDDEGDERLAAFVVLAETGSDVIAALEDLLLDTLGPAKVPSRWSTVDRLPADVVAEAATAAGVVPGDHDAR